MNKELPFLINKYFGRNIYLNFTPFGLPAKDSEGNFMWPLQNKFPVDNKTKHIIFNDFSIWKDEHTCVELEWYISNIKDIHNYIFYVPHFRASETYPDLNIVYYNQQLDLNACFFNKHKEMFLHYFDNIKRDVNQRLCLMRSAKRDRIVFYKYLSDMFTPEELSISLQEKKIMPRYPGIPFDQYWDRWPVDTHAINVKNFLSLIRNYQEAEIHYAVETNYRDYHSFITEKTLQPFLAKQTVIPLTQKNYCKHLSYYGFNLDYLDKTFDKAEHHERYKLAVELNKNALDPEPEYNQQLALNLHDKIISLLDTELDKLTSNGRL